MCSPLFNLDTGLAEAVGKQAQPQLAIRRNHLWKGYPSHYLPALRIVAVSEDLPVRQ